MLTDCLAGWMHGWLERLCLFFRRKVLNVSGGLDQIGSINWQLALCLLLSWIVCYFCVWKGVKSTGRVCNCSINVCLLACLPACLLACLPACLPACLLACLPACLPVCLLAWLFY